MDGPSAMGSVSMKRAWPTKQIDTLDFRNPEFYQMGRHSINSSLWLQKSCETHRVTHDNLKVVE
eukprot:825353-Amphidinium_carterae.2